MSSKKPKSDALAPAGAPADQPLAIMALSPDNSGVLSEVIRENFGATGLRLSDVDRIKIPGAGGTHWLVPSITNADGDATKELTGVIVAWADKKAWWSKQFGTDGSASPPDCKSEDMVHGLGLPTIALNQKETLLVDEGKAQGQPTRDTGGWLCSTCPHNVFGSAQQGGGKACKDMRFIVMVLADAVLPVLVRIPPTSLLPIRQYFKRLAAGGKRYYGTVTTLTLKVEKNDSKIDYAVIVPTAARFLSAEELGGAQAYHALFQPMLESDGAVEAGLVDKAGSDEQRAAESPTVNAPADAELARNAARPTGDDDGKTGDAQQSFN